MLCHHFFSSTVPALTLYDYTFLVSGWGGASSRSRWLWASRL